MQLIAVTLSVALGAAPLELGQLLKDLPQKATAATQPVGTRADGVEVVQTSCVSRASPAELKAHFIELFKRAGLYLAPEQEELRFEKGDQVTGLDAENLVSYTALLQPSGKLTTVVLAVAQVGMPRQDPAPDAFAPVFPGATALTTFRFEGVRAMTFASTATPAQLSGFYADTLTKAGWVRSAEGGSYVKGGQQLTVTVSPGTSERYVMVQLRAAGP